VEFHVKTRLKVCSYLVRHKCPAEFQTLSNKLVQPSELLPPRHSFSRRNTPNVGAMASLRQRVADNSKSGKRREKSPAKTEEVRLVPVSKIITDTNKPKTRKRRNGLIFFLGGVFGLLAAGFFAQRRDLLDFPELRELSMESLIEVLPAGFISDARDLAVSALQCDWDYLYRH
jgi:hypothetical protein